MSKEKKDNTNILKEPKVIKGINVFVLLFCVLVVAAVLSYILPAGEYQRELVNGRDVVVPNTYKLVSSSPVGFFGVFASIHQGLVDAGPIIFYVLIIGGMFEVMNTTGTIHAMLSTLSKKLANKGLVFIAILMFIFSVGGSLIGMAEENLIYIPLMIPIALSLGYDVITGAAIVLMGAGVGFTTAVMNPFTVGIAQNIAKLPMFSGIGVRLVLYVIMYVTAVAYVYRYAEKVKKDPSLGYFGDGKFALDINANAPEVKLERKHKFVLFAFVCNFSVLTFGVMKLGWGMQEMSALFVILSILIAVIARLSADQYVDAFMKGAAGILVGALVIGMARAIVVVLTNGKLIDTILFNASGVLQYLPASLSAAGMFVIQALIHFIVPSGSGQAALTMPIMVPLADLLNVTRQTSVLVFSLADGIGNTIFPTSGYFMAGLAIAGVPWQKWAKVMIKLVVLQYIIAIIAVVLANMFHYGPF